jgi:hypothetical protein
LDEDDEDEVVDVSLLPPTASTRTSAVAAGLPGVSSSITMAALLLLLLLLLSVTITNGDVEVVDVDAIVDELLLLSNVL